MNPRVWPSRSELGDLQPAAVRTIVYDVNELLPLLRRLPRGVRVIALFNGELVDVDHDWARWPEAMARAASKLAGTVDAIEVVNEWDLLGVPVEVVGACVRQAVEAWQGTGVSVLLGSVAGPDWQAALGAAMGLLEPVREQLSGVCLHPYGQRPDGWSRGDWGFGEMAAAIGVASAISGLPVWLTEMGVKVGDAGGAQGQAEYLLRAMATLERLGAGVVPVGCWFAAHDAIGAPWERGEEAFGLRDERGRRRPSWWAFAAASRFGGWG